MRPREAQVGSHQMSVVEVSGGKIEAVVHGVLQGQECRNR